MMGKTHITVGIATSLVACQPATLKDLFAAVIGGAVGGVICDIECRSRPEMRDALYARFITLGIVAAILLVDWITKTGLCVSIMEQPSSTVIMGVVVSIIVCIAGRFSEHRTFTHSLLFVLLIDFGLFCICPEISFPVLVGGISHLFIDTFNKKPVPWLFPFFRPGVCFKLCYASKVANAVIMWVGLVADLGMFAWSLTRIL